VSEAVIVRVLYELFDFEASVLDEPGADVAHCIDREIRLDMSDDVQWFISWSNDPVQHCVGVARRSFFLPEGATTVDASGHPLWRRLVGQPIEFVSLDAESQVVEVRSPSGSVYLSSQERGYWLADATTVSASRPVVSA
jgi:hypothetical protein